MGEAVLEAARSQIRDSDPPETRQTLDRLVQGGMPEDEALKSIACVLSSEMFAILKEQRPYDHEAYLAGLDRLPRLPWE